MNIYDIYGPEQVAEVIKLIVDFSVLVVATSVGNFARGLLFSSENSFKQNVGLSLISGAIAFALTLKFAENITIPIGFLICFGLGFFIPSFKDWLKDKTLAKIIAKAALKSSDLATSVLEEVSHELDEEE